MSDKVYVIAEASQGYEGCKEISKLLVRGAKQAGADAIKFQVVYADDLAEKGYQYYELFQSLEMSLQEWSEVRCYARSLGIDFIIDIFGPKSFLLADELKPNGLKIHSTCFFDHDLITNVLKLNTEIYFSVGGIEEDEINTCIEKYNLNNNKRFNILYGFQSEPTPIGANNLLRIPTLRKITGTDKIGFMDHSDGSGEHKMTLSALALGLGVRIFEKHITIARGLEMEDYISALGISEFKLYVENLHSLYEALGDSDLSLKSDEKTYRNKAIKRVVSQIDLLKGHHITKSDIKLSRPTVSEGYFRIEDVLGKKLNKNIRKGEPVVKGVLG